MQDKSYFMGKDGFTWFVGCVEDRNDPERLGRVRVRCLGYHTEDKSKIPTEDLPWASVMSPTTTPSMNGLGETPSFLVPGSWVVGFFTDAQTMQEPIIMGTLPGKNSTQGDKTKGFTDATNPNIADFGPYPVRVQETDVNRLAVPSLIHGNRESRDGAYTSGVPIALASGLGAMGTLFTGISLGVGIGTGIATSGIGAASSAGDTVGGFLDDVAPSNTINAVEAAAAEGITLTSEASKHAVQGYINSAQSSLSLFPNEPFLVMKNPLGGAFSSVATSGTTSATNALSTTLGLAPNLEFGGFAQLIPRSFDSASKIAVTASAIGKIAGGDLSPGGTLAALAATPIGGEVISAVTSEVADSVTGLLSQETTAFLTDNFDTIVDLGQAAYQIADGDKIVGLMSGVTATFNAFNKDTHIDIGDYKVSLPQVTNTLADVIATGLTAPTTQAGYILSGAKLLALTDPIGALTDSDPKISRYLYNSISVDANGDFNTAGLERQAELAVLDASAELGKRLGEDIVRQRNLQSAQSGRLPVDDDEIMSQLVRSYKQQTKSQVFQPTTGWDFVGLNNKSNYYAGGGIRKSLVEEVFKQDAISKRVSGDEGFTPSGSYLINENALVDVFNTRTDNDGNFISTLSAGTKSIIKDTANNLAQNLVMEHKGNEKDLINKVGTAFGVDVNIRPDPVANTITIDTETGRRQTTGPTTTSGGTWDEPRTTDTNFAGMGGNSSYGQVGGISTETGLYRQAKLRVDPEYPYNHIKETEAGHIKEYDDTPGAERIMEYHRAGTFYEVDADGTKVTRVVGNNYEIIAGTEFVNIKGTCNLTIDQNCNTYIKGNWNIQVDGNKTEVIKGSRFCMVHKTDTLNVAAARTKIVGAAETNTIGGAQMNTVGGAILHTAGAFISEKAGAEISNQAGARITHTAGGNYSVTAPRIDLN